MNAVRQTEVAVTGLGPSILSNTVSNRPAANITTRATAASASVATTSVTEDLSADSPYSAGAASIARPLPPTSLPQPRPAYIAAQFLAQDLSAEEVAQFFAAEIQPAPLRQPAQQAREVRVVQQQPVNNMQNTPAPITINQSALASTPAPVQVRAQQPTPQAEPVQRQERRATVAQVQGQSAYRAANIRNALLASAPEVDTRL